MGRLIALAAAVALSGFACLPAFADSFSVSNTGSNAGAALPIGVTDPHYTLISAPSGVSTPAAITTAPNAAWTPNTSTADWISPGSSGNTSWPVGTYEYQVTFTISPTDNPATATLAGMWTADNSACINLNGAATGDCIGDTVYGSLHAFSITSGFVSGLNTLDFIVNNTTTTPTPTGLIVDDLSGTVSSVVPEPSSLLLLGTGLSGLGLFYRRLRHAR